MSTLTISDLSLDNELDATAMAEVSGGYMGRRNKPRKCRKYGWMPRPYKTVNKTTITGTGIQGDGNIAFGSVTGVNLGDSSTTFNGAIKVSL